MMKFVRCVVWFLCKYCEYGEKKLPQFRRCSRNASRK